MFLPGDIAPSSSSEKQGTMEEKQHHWHIGMMVGTLWHMARRCCVRASPSFCKIMLVQYLFCIILHNATNILLQNY